MPLVCPGRTRLVDRSAYGGMLVMPEAITAVQRQEAFLKAGALQAAIFNSANFSSIATDAQGVIQIFNVGAERMLGYAAADVMNKITPADISDPEELIARAEVAERRARDPDHAGLRGAGLQGLARHRGHLRADLHPQGRQPLPGRRLGHGAARRAGRHHRLPADRHRQHGAQAGRGEQELLASDCATRVLHALAGRERDRLRDRHAPIPRGSSPTSAEQMEALTGCTRDELIGATVQGALLRSGRGPRTASRGAPPAEDHRLSSRGHGAVRRQGDWRVPQRDDLRRSGPTWRCRAYSRPRRDLRDRAQATRI